MPKVGQRTKADPTPTTKPVAAPSSPSQENALSPVIHPPWEWGKETIWIGGKKHRLETKRYGYIIVIADPYDDGLFAAYTVPTLIRLMGLYDEEGTLKWSEIFMRKYPSILRIEDKAELLESTPQWFKDWSKAVRENGWKWVDPAPFAERAKVRL